MVLLVPISVAYYLIKRYRPMYAKQALLALRACWAASSVVILTILFVIDILRRPDWLPFFTGIH